MPPGLRAQCAAAGPLVPEFMTGREAIMAGKMQLAAKCLLGTTLLASGTGGVYYATTNGWTSRPLKPKQQTAELDALTSAWAEPAAKHAPTADQSSKVARSADEVVSHEHTKVVKPAEVDRYAPPAPAA